MDGAEAVRTGAATAGARAASGLDAAAVRQVWPEVLETVRGTNKVAWTVLSSGVTVGRVERDELTLGFENPNLIRGFVAAGRDIVLREALLGVLGVAFRITAVPAAELEPARSGHVSAASRPEPRPAAPLPEPPEDEPYGDEPADDTPEARPELSGEDAALALVKTGLGGRVIGGTDAG